MDNHWRAAEQMDKVLDCLEGRLDWRTAVIQSTSAQERLLAPAAVAEVEVSESTEDPGRTPMHLCFEAASKSTG